MPGHPLLIESPSLGDAWLEAAHAILERGQEATYDELPVREARHLTLVIERADPDDTLIARLGDPEWLEWMRANFESTDRVAELGDARSYASRLFDYAGTGRDQLAWVVERLRADPASRSATITTFEPLSDTTYIPCVSLLDFWLRDGAVELAVYAHSIDFGAKGYGNLVELALLQARVAESLDRPVGGLRFIVKSAHVYDTERERMLGIVADA